MGFFLFFTASLTAQIYPKKLGDLNGDDLINAADLATLINHIYGIPRLNNENAVFADVNMDGVVNNVDVDMVADAILGLRTLPELPFTRILESSPAHGDSGVSVTRETILRFTAPLSTNTLVTPQNLYAEFGGQKLVARIELATDRRRVSLFYTYPLPGSARVRVTFKGDGFSDFAGRPIDADGDGQPGGVAIIDFDTLSQTPLAGTIVCGRVFASELAIPGNGDTNRSVNVPLAGVTITADGLEQDVRVVTDHLGDFRITNAPAGAFFVHIDGRTVTNLADGVRWPDLAYYPNVGKRWESIPGQEVNISNVFLPRIPAGTLKAANPTNETVLTFQPDFIALHPEFAGVTVRVPPGSIYSDSGARGGMVGIAPVPPDRLPGPLNEGLYIQDVITIQTDGPSNFDQPIPVCFPNLPDPRTGEKLPPGGKSALWSFNHDTGRFEIVGSATVSEDGMLVCTDPGVGILAPGWHLTQPGASGGGGGGGGGGDCDGGCCSDCCDQPADQQECCKAAGGGGGGGGAGGNGTNPIQLHSGEKWETAEDLRIPGVGMDFIWQRSYRSRISRTSTQGVNWDFSYNLFILREGRGLAVCDGSAKKLLYHPRTDGTWARNGLSRVLNQEADQSFCLTYGDGRKICYHAFDGTPAEGKVTRIVDRNDNTMSFFYDTQGRLDRIRDTLDRDIFVTYNQEGYIAAVTDFTGRSVRYTYYRDFEAGGSAGDLKTVTSPAVVGTPNSNDFPNGKTVSYTYSKGFTDERLNHNLLTITDGRRNDPNDSTRGQGPYLVNVYSTTTNPDDPMFDRAVRQIRGGDIVDLAYIPQTPTAENDWLIMKTIVRDREGNVAEYFYKVSYLLVRERHYTGRADPTRPTTETENRPTGKLRSSDPDYFETRYEYNGDFALVRTIHPNGNITENIYESDLNPDAPARTRRNLREVRRLPGAHLPTGDSPIIVERYEYDGGFACQACGFNFVSKYTDGRGNVILSAFDARGNLMARTNQITSIVEEWEYNARGQMTKHRLPDNGSGSRRQDVVTYYESGPQRGYVKEQIVDAANLALTTTFEYDAVGNMVRKTDPSGHDRQYLVNQLNQIVREISVEVFDGSGIRYIKESAYDANNNLKRTEVLNLDEAGVTQPNNRFTTTYEYEMLNFLVRKTEEVSATHSVVTEYGYDRNRNRTLIRLGEATAGRQPDNVLLRLYDERNLLFQESRALGGPDQSTAQYDYDGNRNRIRVWRGLESDPRLHRYTFDGYNRLVGILDPMGNTTTYQYDANANRTNTMVWGELVDGPGSANNVRLSQKASFYDPADRMVREETAYFDAATQSVLGPERFVVQTVYSDHSQVIRVVNQNGHVTSTLYDTACRRSQVTDAKGNTVRYEYDADDNLVRVTETEKADLGGADQIFVTANTYDNLNRLTSTIDNAGNRTRWAYDSRNNCTRQIDANTNEIRYIFDGLNRLLETRQTLTQTGLGTGAPIGTLVTRQNWDDSSRLVAQIDDQQNATSYRYDGLGRQTAIVFADGTTEVRGYDVQGNPVLVVDGNGNVITGSFDALDRLVRKDIVAAPGVSVATTFESFQYDGLSRLVQAADDDSVITRSFDSLSRMTSEVQNGAMISSTYDGFGNQTRCLYPGGRVVTTTFDELERKSSLSDEAGDIARFYYVGPTRLAQRDYGNGTRTVWQYDGMTGQAPAAGDFGVKRPVRITHSRIADGAILEDRGFRWDRVGNKVGAAELRAGGTQPTRDYSYDSAYRLVRSASVPAGTSISYAMDGAGNRTSITGGADAGNYTLDATAPEPADRQMNQYTATPRDTRAYDRNSNLTSLNGASVTLVYDYRNQLVLHSNSVTGLIVSYAYDVLGRRLGKSVQGGPETLYVYNDWQEILEVDTTSGLQTSSVYGQAMGELLNRRSGASHEYFHADDLHSVLAITDGGGTVVARASYSDFGVPAVTGNATNPFLFTGQRYDSETGYYYLRTRYLDPGAGRFISRDRIGVWGDSKNLGNAFNYVGNNPLTFTDPMGLSVCSDAKAAGLDNGDAGGVICKDGKKHVCPWYQPGTTYADASFTKCVTDHEKDHLDDIDCPKDCKLNRPNFKKDKDPQKEECSAYKVEAACLKNEKTNKCKGLEGAALTKCNADFDWLIADRDKQVTDRCN